MHAVAMIYQIRHGLCLSRTCLGGQVLGAATRETIDCLSTRFCGFCARARLSEICRQIMAAGATRTVVLSAGETKGFGRVYSQKWCNSLMLNG
jgi:hypothetical protein